MIKLSNKNRTISFRVNEREGEILDNLCEKYGKKTSSLIIFLLEKEYYYTKEDDEDE